MDDPELQAIRQQRLAQMQQQYGGSGGGGNSEDAAKQEQMRAAQEDAKNSILSQILDQEARARLNTLKLSKPEKAQAVENLVCRMAQTGQIAGKMDDKQFRSVLESISAQMPRSTSSVKFDRRRVDLDDSDEDYGL